MKQSRFDAPYYTWESPLLVTEPGPQDPLSLILQFIDGWMRIEYGSIDKFLIILLIIGIYAIAFNGIGRLLWLYWNCPTDMHTRQWFIAAPFIVLMTVPFGNWLLYLFYLLYGTLSPEVITFFRRILEWPNIVAGYFGALSEDAGNDWNANPWMLAVLAVISFILETLWKVRKALYRIYRKEAYKWYENPSE